MMDILHTTSMDVNMLCATLILSGNLPGLKRTLSSNGLKR